MRWRFLTMDQEYRNTDESHAPRYRWGAGLAQGGIHENRKLVTDMRLYPSFYYCKKKKDTCFDGGDSACHLGPLLRNLMVLLSPPRQLFPWKEPGGGGEPPGTFDF
jgi:hypothetical protein